MHTAHEKIITILIKLSRKGEEKIEGRTLNRKKFLHPIIILKVIEHASKPYKNENAIKAK